MRIIFFPGNAYTKHERNFRRDPFLAKKFSSVLPKNSKHFCRNHFAKPVSAKNSAVISFAEPKTWFLSCLANIDIDCLAPFLKNIPHVMNV